MNEGSRTELLHQETEDTGVSSREGEKSAVRWRESVSRRRLQQPAVFFILYLATWKSVTFKRLSIQHILHKPQNVMA